MYKLGTREERERPREKQSLREEECRRGAIGQSGLFFLRVEEETSDRKRRRRRRRDPVCHFAGYQNHRRRYRSAPSTTRRRLPRARRGCPRIRQCVRTYHYVWALSRRCEATFAIERDTRYTEEEGGELRGRRENE